MTAEERAEAAEAKLAELADPRVHPDPTRERLDLAKSRPCPVCLVEAGGTCNLWSEENAGNSFGVHYERFALVSDAVVSERHRAVEVEEKYAQLKKEHARVIDILFRAISGEATPHAEEMPKDIASTAAARIREYASRFDSMNARIEADPHYLSRVAAYDRLIERIPEWEQRWLPTQLASNAVAREAKTVLLGITAARTAGFPLAVLEDLVMKFIDAEKQRTG